MIVLNVKLKKKYFLRDLDKEIEINLPLSGKSNEALFRENHAKLVRRDSKPLPGYGSKSFFDFNKDVHEATNHMENGLIGSYYGDEEGTEVLVLEQKCFEMNFKEED